MTETTIRMVRCPDRTLWGYIFKNVAHAKGWLKNYKPDDVVLEKVEVGPLLPCRSCKGEGWHQNVKKIESLTLEELRNV